MKTNFRKKPNAAEVARSLADLRILWNKPPDIKDKGLVEQALVGDTGKELQNHHTAPARRAQGGQHE